MSNGHNGETQRRNSGMDCPAANLVLRLLALNVCDHVRINLTRLAKIAILTTLKSDRHKEKSVGSDIRLRIF